MGLFGSIYTGCSGVYATSIGMKVIADNISNLNTTGFKGSRYEFMNELLSCTQEVLEKEKGLGCFIKNIRTLYTQGGITTTDISTDLAISGKGFFIVQDKDGNIFYTRDGQFFINEVDEDHLALQNSMGMYLLGADPTATSANLDNLQPYLIPKVMDAKATSNIKAELILDSRKSVNDQTLIDKYDAQSNPEEPIGNGKYDWVFNWSIYDNKGDSIPLKLYVDRGNTSNSYEMLLALADPSLDGRGNGKFKGAFLYGNLTFGASGDIVSADFSEVGVDGTLTPIDLTQTGKPVFNLNINGNNQSITLDLGFTVNSDSSIKRESGVIKMLANPFTQLSFNQDGYPQGIFDRIEVITEEGLIRAWYTNQKTIDVSRIFLADFSGYEDSLDKIGGNLFKTKSEAIPFIFAPGSGTRGRLLSGALETSNVDLATEMVNLITLQRTFQSNIRVINTAYQMLEDFLSKV
ncbi:flagellar hook protein FlgE [Thermodesulfobacterium hydrogeniphilum]|uniref:flagellar hook protein FlgE n=1 Tax=Thermodesulfobacterium hydrogeniphilum TaxID=161156 RepID=UPI00057033B1|nr:flagellar hook-basal body complex protein [Thermodesulfobacterium hydrogeniphilum]